MRAVISEHRHFIVVVTLLTLVMTWPTALYVLRTDVFWLPTGKSTDVFIKLWDTWYVKQILSGEADRAYTNLIFYPEGVSLVFQPIFIPHALVVNGLNLILPLTNAFILAHLLIIWSSALATYVYILWLLRDKWIALFGAVVFGLSPHVTSHANHTEVSFVMTISLALYAFHRGLLENRQRYIIVSGLLMGLTSISSLYAFVCGAITLAFAIVGLALTRWRDKRYWVNTLLLLATIAVSSAPRLIPMLSSSRDFEAALRWHGEKEIGTDLISYFVNHRHPIIGTLGDALLQTPARANLSHSSFLGYLPLLLVGMGLLSQATRRRALPWLALWLFFIALRLGSFLQVNGVAFPNLLLPKYYLNQLLPHAFAPFHEADILYMGVLLPLAVLSCCGLVALRERLPSANRRWILPLLIALLAFEYYIPVQERRMQPQELAFVEWLAVEEAQGEIRLVYLPMGRSHAKRYNYFQVLTGYPHAEGAIARTPESAYDSIRANPMLNAWHEGAALSCEPGAASTYRSALQQMIGDRFSHVVWHRHFGSREAAEAIDAGFSQATPFYRDDFVSIYRLSELLGACPG